MLVTDTISNKNITGVFRFTGRRRETKYCSYPKLQLIPDLLASFGSVRSSARPADAWPRQVNFAIWNEWVRSSNSFIQRSLASDGDLSGHTSGRALLILRVHICAYRMLRMILFVFRHEYYFGNAERGPSPNCATSGMWCDFLQWIPPIAFSPETKCWTIPRGRPDSGGSPPQG